MQLVKLAAAVAMAACFVTAPALAGDNCSAKQASACSAKKTAACAKMTQDCKVEATRLASGDLVVHYSGTTPEAIAHLQAQASGKAAAFCCPMTQKMAANESCTVDIAKVSNGVIVVVSSPKKELVDTYEKEFAAMTAAPAATR